jgi:hypothetical protein
MDIAADVPGAKENTFKGPGDICGMGISIFARGCVRAVPAANRLHPTAAKMYL